MEFSYLIIVFGLLWILQYIMSYGQTRNYNYVIREVSQSNSGFLGVGLARSKFNLGPGTVVILAIDLDGQINDYRELHGFSVFKRFRKKEEWIGKQVGQIEKVNFKKTQKKAYEQALSLINDERKKKNLGEWAY